MKRQLILIAVLIASSTFAQQSNDELGKLRESYTKAVERATAPVKATYITELKKLMEKQTKAGNLDGALAVKSELETQTGASTSAASPESTPAAAKAGEPAVANPGGPTNPRATKGKRLTRAELKEIEKRFVNSLWVVDNKDWAFYYFRSDGTFARVMDTRTGNKLNEKWELRDDGVVLWGGERCFTFPNAEQGQVYVQSGAAVIVTNLKVVPGGKDPDK